MNKKQQASFHLDRQRLGVFGEEIAAAEYRRLGYDIFEANYHSRFGELDLIACSENCIVFVEVRTRDATAAITPAETVTIHKQRRLILTAQHYLQQNPELADMAMRFDVVEVFYHGGYDYRLNRIENAFTL